MSLIENQAKNEDQARLDHAKRIVEALLFASSEPLPVSKMREILESSFPITSRELKKILDELSENYRAQERAFQLENIAEGYVLRTSAAFSPYIRMLFEKRKKERLSQASLETLAIIAYKQPITKAQIELIRGVDCSGVLQHLQERALIEVSGKLEAPGRPSLFATTREFLKYFGLKSLADMPNSPVNALQDSRPEPTAATEEPTPTAPETFS